VIQRCGIAESNMEPSGRSQPDIFWGCVGEQNGTAKTDILGDALDPITGAGKKTASACRADRR